MLGGLADQPARDVMRPRTAIREAVRSAEQCRHNHGYPDDRERVPVWRPDRGLPPVSPQPREDAATAHYTPCLPGPSCTVSGRRAIRLSPADRAVKHAQALALLGVLDWPHSIPPYV